MAFSAALTTQGFEHRYNLSGKAQGDEEFIKDYPSAVNTAFTLGQMMTISGGAITPSTSLDANVLGAVQKTVAATTYGAGKLPVLITPDAVYRVSVVGINEETVAAATSTQQTQGYFTAGTGWGTNDYPNDAYLVVYDGADKGAVYTIRDYVHGSLYYYIDRPHKMDTTSKLYILGLLDNDAPIGLGTEIDIVNGSASTVAGNTNPSGAPFRVVELTKEDALNGTIHVKITRPQYCLDI